MMRMIKKDLNYTTWLKELKNKVRHVQIKAAVRVNTELLQFYWDLGQDIVKKQKSSQWGDGFLKQLSFDLSDEFPDIKGFSKRNLELIRKWFLFWSQSPLIAKQAATQIQVSKTNTIFMIPWWHHVVILTKIRDSDEAFFYVHKTIQNNWSRAVLTHHIEGDLYKREGKAITNFKVTLPKPQSDLARETLKNPYNFDFLTLTQRHDEKKLENELVNHITRFLLELGSGFSYVGKQYKLEVNGDEFIIDLLFYHIKLHCYVVIELKAVKFKPEYAGKLNFYISAVDGLLKTENDNPTIGILICKSKNDTVVEYSLKDVHKPIGVSEYIITKNLPAKFKSTLPSIKEIEAELAGDIVEPKFGRKKKLK